MWNHAQHYAMSENSFGTTFGPSSPGAINLISGDTGGAGIPRCTKESVHPGELAERSVRCDPATDTACWPGCYRWDRP
ncbi:MAG: alkaline phosphatase family protein [Pseudonocardiaceae bacterium]